MLKDTKASQLEIHGLSFDPATGIISGVPNKPTAAPLTIEIEGKNSAWFLNKVKLSVKLELSVSGTTQTHALQSFWTFTSHRPFLPLSTDHQPLSPPAKMTLASLHTLRRGS